MICFDDGVQVLRRAMFCVFAQLAVTPEQVNRFWVRGEFICRDLRRRPSHMVAAALFQKAVCCADVSPLQEHEVDQPAVLVHCSEQVRPAHARRSAQKSERRPLRA